MNVFEKAEEIRQWLIAETGQELRQCGITAGDAELELQALAGGVALYLARMALYPGELPEDQMHYIRRLDLFQLFSEINMSDPARGALHAR